ncbi:hypothetical protein [uncultured Chitinophaga sp.]|uniref:hypothetical protein n=1 Tax=uncultured Chitinophaga sp. TaxID=339340 RepID=UPI002600A73C|nr:hypothetical protein [uncultured Chitinophaga sp.]
MQEPITIYNTSLKSRAGYLASTLLGLCVILLAFYLIALIKGKVALNFSTDKQIVTILCGVYLTYTLFVKHFAAIQFDHESKIITISTFRIIGGFKEHYIPFDDFFYYEEERRIKFRDRIFFYRLKKEIAGVPKRHLKQLPELHAALAEVEKLYPEEA